MKGKKVITFLMAAMMTVPVFGACGGGGGNGGGNGGGDSVTVNLNVDKNIKADISILIPGGNENEQTMINCLIEDFCEEYPNVTISKSFVTVGSYENTVRSLAAANSLDDIIWSNSPDFYYCVSKNYVQNLNPYIEASEAAGVFNLEEDFYKEFFDCGTLNGNLYCVPRSADSVVTFYNKEILTSAGVDLETVVNGWTWDTFMDACAKVRTWMDANNKSNHYVLDANLTTWLSVCYPMLASYGADVFDENGNVILNSEATNTCLEMVREMVDKRYICDSTSSSGSSFESGTSAFLFQSASVSLFANRKSLKGKIDIVSFPLIMDNNTPKIGAGIAGYCISKFTQHKDLCWQFLNYMLSYDGQQRMGANGLNLASIRKDLSDHTTANWGKGYENLNLNAYLYGSEYKLDASFLSRVPTEAKPDITTAITDLFANVSNPNKKVSDCLKNAIDDINDALDI